MLADRKPFAFVPARPDEAGIEPRVVEYLKTPADRKTAETVLKILPSRS